MFPRRRSVLTALMLCGGAALCLLLFLQVAINNYNIVMIMV